MQNADRVRFQLVEGTQKRYSQVARPQVLVYFHFSLVPLYSMSDKRGSVVEGRIADDDQSFVFGYGETFASDVFKGIQTAKQRFRLCGSGVPYRHGIYVVSPVVRFVSDKSAVSARAVQDRGSVERVIALQHVPRLTHVFVFGIICPQMHSFCFRQVILSLRNILAVYVLDCAYSVHFSGAMDGYPGLF